MRIATTTTIIALLACGCSSSTGKPRAPRCAAGARPGPALAAPVELDAAPIAPAVQRAMPPQLGDALDAVIDRAVQRMQPATLTAAVIAADGRTWTRSWAASGTPPARWWWASIGKAFTASVVLQLVDEGKLALDDEVARFLPSVPGGDAITIRQLLAHTSGLFSFQADPAFRAREGHVTPDELLQIAAARGARFCPGTAWEYSNTGYVVLGKLIERLEGAPYHAVVRRRVLSAFEPAELAALAPRERPAGLAMPQPAPGAERPHHDLTTPYAAGVIAGTSTAMARAWWTLIADPRLARRLSSLHRMFDSPVEAYGLGVMVYRLGAADPEERDVWIGHSGGTPGAKAVVAYSMQREAVVAVAITGPAGSPEGIALHLVRVLDAAR